MFDVEGTFTFTAKVDDLLVEDLLNGSAPGLVNRLARDAATYLENPTFGGRFPISNMLVKFRPPAVVTVSTKIEDGSQLRLAADSTIGTGILTSDGFRVEGDAIVLGSQTDIAELATSLEAKRIKDLENQLLLERARAEAAVSLLLEVQQEAIKANLQVKVLMGTDPAVEEGSPVRNEVTKRGPGRPRKGS